MMPVFQLGPLALPLPGIILLLGLWLGLLLAEKNAYRSGIQKDHLYNLVFIGLLAGLIGARLSYVIQYPQVFLDDPIGIISRNLGLLDPWGAAVGALLGGLFYGQRKALSFWHTLDALTPLLAVFSVALGLSHLASGSAFGSPTTLPWSIQLWGQARHPSQVYETILATIIVAMIWPGRGLIRISQPGVYFLGWLALSAAARLFLEAFRGDSTLVFDSFRSAQVLAWLVLGLALWAIARRRRIPIPEE